MSVSDWVFFWGIWVVFAFSMFAARLYAGRCANTDTDTDTDTELWKMLRTLSHDVDDLLYADCSVKRFQQVDEHLREARELLKRKDNR